MKNMRFVLFVAMVVVLGFCFVATAAEYVVQPGDTLTKVAQYTGHTIEQLVLMNEIENRDLIFPGQKLIWVNDEDVEMAKAWAKRRMSELWSCDPNYFHFKHMIESLSHRSIRHSIYECCGVHYESVLICARAEREAMDP